MGDPSSGRRSRPRPASARAERVDDTGGHTAETLTRLVDDALTAAEEAAAAGDLDAAQDAALIAARALDPAAGAGAMELGAFLAQLDEEEARRCR